MYQHWCLIATNLHIYMDDNFHDMTYTAEFVWDGTRVRDL